MNRIVITVLFSSLFILYLYKYSYPKIVEGLTKRQKRIRNKTKNQEKRRITKETKKLKRNVRKSGRSKKEKKAAIKRINDERDYKKQLALDNMSRESNDFYNNYDGMVRESAKHFLQKLHTQIITLSQGILIQLDLSNDNIRIEDRVSKDIANFIGLLKSRINFISKLPGYLNENDKQFEKTQSALLTEVNNTSFIENVSQAVAKLINHYEQKGSALKVPTFESSSSDFNYHFNSIDNISDKLVILRKIMKETNGVTIKKEGVFGPGAVPIETIETIETPATTTEDN
jgi:hypothetical protein